MSVPFRFFVLTLLGLLAPIPGCDPATPEPQPPSSTSPPNNPEPTLTLGPGATYHPNQSWHQLSEAALQQRLADDTHHDHQPKPEQRRALLTGQSPVAVIHLSDRVRLYHLAIHPDHWQPTTLCVLDENDQPVHTVRLDLPPVGVARVALPNSPHADGLLRLRITRAAPEIGQPRPTLLDRQLGTPATPLDADAARALGFGTSSEWQGTPPADVTALSQLPGAELTGSRWSVSVISATTSVSADHWKSIVLGERGNAFVSHSGNPDPDETWWTDTVLNHLPFEPPPKPSPAP